MGLRKMSVIFLALLISGCAGPSAARRGMVDEGQVRTFASIYRKAKEARQAAGFSGGNISRTPDAGEEAPYFPVYEHGRIARVWVPPHVAIEDKGVFVAGHWTFVMVEEPHWYIERDVAGRITVPMILPGLPLEE